MSAGRNVTVGLVQMFYLFVTPVMSWWIFGGIGLAVWLLFTIVWTGATVVIWSAYLDRCSGRSSFRQFLFRALLSPLLGPLWAAGVTLAICRLPVSLLTWPPSQDAGSKSGDRTSHSRHLSAES